MSANSLRMEHISRSFGPVKALQDVTFTARGGTVHALCGENGAGKSTLMKILSGVYAPDSGTVYLDGEAVRLEKPADALQAGISMLYQELDLAEDLKVYENVFLGREILSGIRLNTPRMIRETAELLARYNFHIDPCAEVKDLSMGECQIVELVKAIMRRSRIIIMDEPTSSLSAAESEALFQIIRQLRSEGMIIIYISHRLEEVKQLADDISILRDGKVVCSAPAAELSTEQIIHQMVGRELTEYYPPRHAEIGDVVFEARDLSGNNGVAGVSFTVHRGEILGFAGLVGAGRSETADLIFGVSPKTSGEIRLHGKTLKIASPADAIQAGIAYLTEDRKRTGLCTELSCGWNLTMPNLEKIGMGRLLNLVKEKQYCMDYGAKVGVKWTSPESPANALSGGNQQKVLVARWLMAESDFLIFDEPTRGIDVGAKKEIYTILNSLAERGCAILVISSELPELLGICDRISVMRGGTIRGTFDRANATPEKIMRLAATTGE